MVSFVWVPNSVTILLGLLQLLVGICVGSPAASATASDGGGAFLPVTDLEAHDNRLEYSNHQSPAARGPRALQHPTVPSASDGAEQPVQVVVVAGAK